MVSTTITNGCECPISPRFWYFLQFFTLVQWSTAIIHGCLQNISLSAAINDGCGCKILLSAAIYDGCGLKDPPKKYLV